MVEPVAGLVAWLLCFEPPHHQETLQEEMAEGKFERFHVVTLNGQEKKFTKLIKFILVFTSYSTSNAPKTMELRFPHAPHLSHLPSTLTNVAATCFWLVGAFKIINRQPSKAVVYFTFIYFSLLNLTPQSMGWCPPTHSPPPCASTQTPPLPLFPNIGLIVVCHHQTVVT
jgi:hypothetical protein